MDEESAPKRPTHDVLAAREGKNGRTYYYKIGAAFEHEDKQGSTADVVATPISGRFILRPAKERIEDLKAGKSERPNAREKTSRRSSRDEYER
jgi:hypothetical protein